MQWIDFLTNYRNRNYQALPSTPRKPTFGNGLSEAIVTPYHEVVRDKRQASELAVAVFANQKRSDREFQLAVDEEATITDRAFNGPRASEQVLDG